MKEKYRNPANPERVRAMNELRRSNAAGVHLDRRERRRRSRAAAKDAARREQES